MKHLLFFIIVAGVSLKSQAQLFNEPRFVDPNDVDHVTITSGDLDNDGDQDVITINSQVISWYENTNGIGNFGEPIILDTGIGQSFYQLVVDLDQDGMDDIILSLFDQDRFVWYRNTGGGSFALPVNLATNLNTAAGVVAGDIDGDGDLDLVLGVSNGVGLYWIEHLDGQGTFSTKIPISTTLSLTRTQRLGDIDGDGDLDIVTNSLGQARLSWYENTDGQGTFSGPTIIEDSGLYHNHLFIVDFDNDNDIDVVSISDNITWYENEGAGNYGLQQIINPINPGTNYGGLSSFDIDNDDDFDILFTTNNTNGPNYQLNNGSGVFNTPVVLTTPITFAVSFIVPVDIDGDGDLDIVSRGDEGGANDPTNLVWYENLTILNGIQNSMPGLVITPNPVQNTLHIYSPIPLQKITLFQVLGQPIKTFSTGLTQIDVSFLSSGIYFIQLENQKGENMVKKVIKK